MARLRKDEDDASSKTRRRRGGLERRKGRGQQVEADDERHKQNKTQGKAWGRREYAPKRIKYDISWRSSRRRKTEEDGGIGSVML